jgi:hypothetical protein
VTGDHDAKAAAARGLVVVVFGDECGERVHELIGEGALVFGGGEADAGFERERWELASGGPGAFSERADRGDRAAGGGEEGAAGEAIADGGRVCGGSAGCTERAGAHDIERCGGLEEVFDAVPAAAFADELEEFGVLEGSDVVADALAGEAEGACDAGGGLGVAEEVEDPEADRVHQNSGLIRGFDDEAISGH